MKQLLKAWPLLDPECALELLDYQVGENVLKVKNKLPKLNNCNT